MAVSLPAHLPAYRSLFGEGKLKKASDIVADVLAVEGVPICYELIGGMITHLLDSIHQRGATKILSVHHEQAAAFAADAAGRISGIPGVALATSGPGATNLLTGIGSCYFDSSPAVFITGQVNRHELRGDRAIRQLGFQETDIVSMAQPITKKAIRVDDAHQLARVLHDAFALAKSGRPGPVLVDLPMDVQNTLISEEVLPRSTVQDFPISGDFRVLQKALRSCKRPLVVAGAGIRAGSSQPAFRKFIERFQLPVVNSLNGVDLLPYSHPLRVGMLGSYGNRWANLAIGQADLLIVLGSRLDIRQTGNDTNSWKGDRQIFHVDVEAGEINNRVEGCEAFLGQLSSFFAKVDLELDADGIDYSDWLNHLNRLKHEWPDDEELGDLPGINPNKFMHQLSQAIPAAATVVDVGQHQMWAAQSIEVREGARYLTSGGMGSMGFALPAALGVTTNLEGSVVVIVGDGGFQCNIQELQTVVRNQLPIKIVVINNRCHGMVRQFQEAYFDKRYQSTVWGYDAPDFEAVAKAYGISASTVSDPAYVESALRNLGDATTGPALLQVMIEQDANAYPKIAFGRPMTEMEPEFVPTAMEST